MIANNISNKSKIRNLLVKRLTTSITASVRVEPTARRARAIKETRACPRVRTSLTAIIAAADHLKI